jgi:hypothetical protein
LAGVRCGQGLFSYHGSTGSVGKTIEPWVASRKFVVGEKD